MDEEMLMNYTGRGMCEPVRQGPKTLSQPMKQFRAQLAGNLVIDGHNPINEWCRMNTSIKTDSNANIQPVKLGGKAKNRIDGMMAELCAYIAYMRHRDEYEANL
jgi:phage terminase large subunit-like protein